MRNGLLALASLSLGCTAVDPLASRTFYVGDQGTGTVSVVASDGVRVLLEDVDPGALAVDPDGLVLADFATGSVRLHDPTTGAVLDLLRENGLGGAVVQEPCGLELEQDRLWVLGNDSRNLVVRDLATAPPWERVYGDEEPLRQAHGFVRHDGEVFVAGSFSRSDLGAIQVLDERTGSRTDHFGDPAELGDAVAIEVVGEELWVADWAGDRLVRFAPDGTWLGEAPEPADGWRHPVQVVASGPSVWVLDDGGLTEVGRVARRVVREDLLPLDFPRSLAVR